MQGIAEGMPCATIFAFVFLLVYGEYSTLLLFMLCLIMSKSLASFKSLKAGFVAPCTSTLCTHNSTCSLVASSMSSSVATSLRISSIIQSSMNLPMSYSGSNLSYSLHWHSAAFVLSLCIHSHADLLFFLFNVQYCSNIMTLFAVLHFSFSSWVKVCISCRPPHHPNHFLSMGPFLTQKVHTIWSEEYWILPFQNSCSLYLS